MSKCRISNGHLGRDVEPRHPPGEVYLPHLYSTVQYSTVQYSTVQYSTVQHSTVCLPHLGPHVPLEPGDERVAGEVSVGVVRALDQSEGAQWSRDPPPPTTAHLVRVLAVAAVVVGGVDRHHDLGLPVDLSIEI